MLEQPDVTIVVTDNASSDNTLSIIHAEFAGKIKVNANSVNYGFCAAHNQGATQFLDSGAEHLLILNPDVRVEAGALEKMVEAFSLSSDIGLVTPKIFRAYSNLEAIEPRTFDAAGMILSNTLRHFDRGSSQQDQGQYDQVEYVFGGTGAALMLSRNCVVDLVLTGPQYDKDLGRVYPFLMMEKKGRLELFDEAFFAYREDADLSWRAGIFGWKCCYSADAVVYHQRKVFSNNRGKIEPELNRYSVRNRFLLQINNFSFAKNWTAILPGLLVRNLLVVLGVILFERSSISGLMDVLRLWRRACERRQIIQNRRRLP